MLPPASEFQVATHSLLGGQRPFKRVRFGELLPGDID
jgi:hypothetical protein